MSFEIPQTEQLDESTFVGSPMDQGGGHTLYQDYKAMHPIIAGNLSFPEEAIERAKLDAEAAEFALPSPGRAMLLARASQAQLEETKADFGAWRDQNHAGLVDLNGASALERIEMAKSVAATEATIERQKGAAEFYGRLAVPFYEAAEQAALRTYGWVKDQS